MICSAWYILPETSIFQACLPEHKIPVTVLLDDKIYHLYVRFLGKELLKIKDGSQYRQSNSVFCWWKALFSKEVKI